MGRGPSLRFEGKRRQNQTMTQEERAGGSEPRTKWPGRPQGASQGLQRQYTTKLGSVRMLETRRTTREGTISAMHVTPRGARAGVRAVTPAEGVREGADEHAGDGADWTSVEHERGGGAYCRT